MIGRTLSHYKVLEEISRGGMGIVYKALDLKLNREVGIFGRRDEFSVFGLPLTVASR